MFGNGNVMGIFDEGMWLVENIDSFFVDFMVVRL